MLRTATSLKKRIGHSGRESLKFRFTFGVHTIQGLATPAQGLPEGATATLQISRGPKVVATEAKLIARGEASFEEEIEFVCTLYASRKGTREFSEKLFRVTFLLSPDPSKRPLEIAVVDLDVAQFATRDPPVSRHPQQPIKLAARSPKAARGALASPADGADLSATIGATFLRDLEVDPDDESISSVNPSFMKHRGGGGGAAPASGSIRPSTRDLYEQDLDGFDDDADGGASETSSVAAYADALNHQAQAAAIVAATPPHQRGSVDLYPAQAAALAAANAQLADVRHQLEEAKAAAAAAATTTWGDAGPNGLGGLAAARGARAPPPMLSAASAGRANAEAEAASLREELGVAQQREGALKVEAVALASRAEHAEALRAAEAAKVGELEGEIAMLRAQAAEAEKRAKGAEAAEQTTMAAMAQVEKQKQRLQAELLTISSEQGDMSIRLNREVAASGELRVDLKKAGRAASEEKGKRLAAESEAEALRAALAIATEEIERARAEAAACEAGADAATALQLGGGGGGSGSDDGAAAAAVLTRGRSAVGLAEEAHRELKSARDAHRAEAEALHARLEAAEARARSLEERAGEADLLEGEVRRLRRMLAEEGDTDDDEEDEGVEDAREGGGGGGGGGEQMLRRRRSSALELAMDAAQKATAEAHAVRIEASKAAAAAQQQQQQQQAALDKALADAAHSQREADAARAQLASALAAAERSASELRVSDQSVRQLQERLDAAGTGGIAPAVAPAAAPAGGGGSVGGGDVEVAPSESAELTELRIELVASKIQVAEAMFDAEQYRGQVSRLQKQLDRLGGSQLETAQRSTQMEVQLAQALSEVAALRSDNEKLSSDVAQMIEMRLQDAESRAGS